MEDVEYISSSSDSDSEPKVIPITNLRTRKLKRRRLGPATEARSSLSCSGCTETLEADGRVYFLPFCSCLYCGRCVLQQILDGLLHLKSALGRAAFELVYASVNDVTKPPTSSINMFVCNRQDHPQLPGAVECYGTACSICTFGDSLSSGYVYLPCGHPFCKSHIAKWFEGKGTRVCPTCRSDVPKGDAHFKRDGTYVLGWPRSFS